MRGNFPANVALTAPLVLAMMTSFFRAVMWVMEVGIGGKARHTLEDMCRDAWNWQRKNPQGFA